MSVYTPYCIYFLFISELRFSISFVGISNEACGDVNVFQYWHTWNWLLMFRLMYSSHRKKWRKFLINWHCLLLTNNGNKIKVNSFIDLAGHCTGFWSLDLSTLWWASFPSTYRYMKGMYVLNYLPGNQFIIFHDFDQEVVAELLFHSQNFFMFLAMQTPLFLTHVYGKVPSLINLVSWIFCLKRF